MKQFKNLREFGDYIKHLNEKLVPLEIKFLEAAGEFLEKDAKKKFGHYQRSNPFYAPWEELSPFTKADRVAQGYPENDPLLREGDLRDSIHHLVNVGMKNLTVYSDSEIMVWQELGTPGSSHPIPPRSVLGLTAFESVEKLTPVLKAMMEAWILDKNFTPKIE